MPNVYHVWCENQADYRVAICQVAAGNETTANHRAKILLDSSDDYVVVKSDVGKGIRRLAEHQSSVKYFNCPQLVDEPQWVTVFRQLLLNGEEADDRVGEDYGITIDELVSWIRLNHLASDVPGYGNTIPQPLLSDLNRLLYQYWEIRHDTWIDRENENDPVCVKHVDVPSFAAQCDEAENDDVE